MHRPALALLAASMCTLLAACEAPAPRSTDETQAPPLFETFGTLHRDTGSAVPGSQRYFDQGLRLAYGFNHEAAGRAFAEAARLDPDCAACAWGQALVLGPNINLPMAPELAPQATALARKAKALSSHARPVDRALIDALLVRYANPAPADRAKLDRAYADAMGKVAAAFPEDDDVAAMYAESLMDLTPWNYWTPAGKPTGDTPTIVATLERVLKRNPHHIGAIHYYIHAVEASDDPGRAEKYADTLGDLAPGSGHLVHMPAHTYLRIGRYHDATLANFRATTADKAFLAVCRGSNGMYPLGYVPHNWHFAVLSAGMQGSQALADQASTETYTRVDMTKLDALNFMQHGTVAPLFTHVRFGAWQPILAMQASPADRPYPTGIWHFARGMAQLRTGDKAAAHAELDALSKIVRDPAMEKLVLGDLNRADLLLKVAEGILRGELAMADGKREAGVQALREAVAVEDTLNYNEPADWPLPARNYLGAALVEAGKPGEAIQAFDGALKEYPKNGWSLYGLAQAQRAMGDAKGADATMARQREAWQWADTPLKAAVF